MSVINENLAIVFTDIVGYTEATASRSRSDTARILSTHNELLLPIVQAFGGRHVKSIGDALLLTFTSPTDALLSAMAMQDTLYSYNSEAPETNQIHIRIAVNVGEVRSSKNDILGDPVNIASRIEALTPPDEIYFSEAVYMTMNKTEVPSSLVGERTLKGIPEPVKVYCVPRFSSTRLVADGSHSHDDLTDTNFPFGGKHMDLPQMPKARTKSLWFIPVLLISILLTFFATVFLVHKYANGKPQKREMQPKQIQQIPITQQKVLPRANQDGRQKVPKSVPQQGSLPPRQIEKRTFDARRPGTRPPYPRDERKQINRRPPRGKNF